MLNNNLYLTKMIYSYANILFGKDLIILLTKKEMGFNMKLKNEIKIKKFLPNYRIICWDRNWQVSIHVTCRVPRNSSPLLLGQPEIVPLEFKRMKAFVHSRTDHYQLTISPRLKILIDTLYDTIICGVIRRNNLHISRKTTEFS